MAWVTQDFAATRGADWAPQLDYYLPGGTIEDGVTFAMQLRGYGGQVGAAALRLDGIAFEQSAAATPDDADRTLLTLKPRITGAMLTALPGLGQPEPGASQVFAHDIRVRHPDGFVEVVSEGGFLLTPGVTVL